MTGRHIPVWVALALASAATAFAEPPHAIFVTTGPGKHVLAIPIDPSTGTQGGPVQVLVTAATPVTDVTQKSDSGLYYATAGEIRRVGVADPVATVAGAEELRFSAYNCLFYNSASGVNSAGCGNPAAVGTGGRGLAFDLFGNLLAIAGTRVVRIPVTAGGIEGAPVPLVEEGLTSPVGIAVAGGKGPNGLERGDFVVLDGRHARLYDAKTGALKNAEYAVVPEGQTLSFGDFDADDRLWLASMVANAPIKSPNGRVYRADAGDAVCTDEGSPNCVLAALLPLLDGKYQPAVGLALGPSSRLITQLIEPVVPEAEQVFKFDFGASIVEITGTVINSCALQVRSTLTPAADAQALISNPPHSLNPYLGDEGFPTVYNIEAVRDGAAVPASSCFAVSSGPFVFIAALTSTEINPRVLRCEEGCGEIEMFGWWHTGPIDGDGEGGGRTDDFSDWLIVEKEVAPADGQVSFCGVAPPLRANRIPVFNSGQNLTVKVQFSAPGQTCNDKARLTDPNAKFLISLARVEPTHEKKRLIDASGNSGVPPIMGLNGKTYDFELSLKEPSGEPYADGLYEITLTDQTPAGTRLGGPVTIYFRLAPK